MSRATKVGYTLLLVISFVFTLDVVLAATSVCSVTVSKLPLPWLLFLFFNYESTLETLIIDIWIDDKGTARGGGDNTDVRTHTLVQGCVTGMAVEVRFHDI